MYIFCDTLSLTQEMLIFLKKHYNAAYSSRAGFDKAEVDIPSHVTRFTGTATVIAKIKPTSSHHNFSVDQVSDMVKSVVARFGPIEEFEVVHTACDAIKYSIEFDSVNDANDAILNTRPGVDMIFGRHEVSVPARKLPRGLELTFFSTSTSPRTMTSMRRRSLSQSLRDVPRILPQTRSILSRTARLVALHGWTRHLAES